jgi:hypothetical protein
MKRRTVPPPVAKSLPPDPRTKDDPTTSSLSLLPGIILVLTVLENAGSVLLTRVVTQPQVDVVPFIPSTAVTANRLALASFFHLLRQFYANCQGGGVRRGLGFYGRTAQTSFLLRHGETAARILPRQRNQKWDKLLRLPVTVSSPHLPSPRLTKVLLGASGDKFGPGRLTHQVVVGTFAASSVPGLIYVVQDQLVRSWAPNR